ncbi:hypothetical protein GDO81_004855 [Engystomops pustulosus]|uniref:Uncharacterized protein n=1 Tax=Engystomops pustulosus TaxID=76066 RepID=A0AAV7CJQ1_ENGPU|nr:hypothetical protein GDO81_004855 [Engystomops pustulosus]
MVLADGETPVIQQKVTFSYERSHFHLSLSSSPSPRYSYKKVIWPTTPKESVLEEWFLPLLQFGRRNEQDVTSQCCSSLSACRQTSFLPDHAVREILSSHMI